MKQLFYFLFAGLFLVGTGCKKDELGANLLSYDGENASGPLLATGYHEAAVLFPSDITGPFTGRQLLRVTYFMGAKPQKAELFIYGEGTPSFPGQPPLYSADITNEITPLRWSIHTLSTPVDITGDDLWIAIGLTHASEQQSIGCDAGPGKTNGDWLYQSSDGQWQSFRNRTGESINWNIRGELSE
ncbi:MAG: hypothetical protein R2824_04735 [Saprospiraceae bacterium]|nr:hypothetical protein [Lewinella sp.]